MIARRIPSSRCFSSFHSLFSHDKLEVSRPLVQRGVVSPRRIVPDHIVFPSYAKSGSVDQNNKEVVILGKEQQHALRESCALAGNILQYAKSLVQPGRSTDEIDRCVHEEIIAHGAYPSPLNYAGFPKSLCSSVNEVVVHGIPDSRELQEGDIVNLDVSVFYNGYHGDTSATLPVGKVDDKGLELLQVTENALHKAISICKNGENLRKIGSVIHDIADEHKFSTVTEFVGHGIGKEFHILPFIMHYRNSQAGEMLSGMAFTIEPMFCEGSNKVALWDDGWTVVTRDHGRSAQFEHTILITDEGAEILTLPSV